MILIKKYPRNRSTYMHGFVSSSEAKTQHFCCVTVNTLFRENLEAM